MAQRVFQYASKIFLVEKMCSVFKVSRGGFYQWTLSLSSKRSFENQIPESEVLLAFKTSKKTYVSPMIIVELRKKGAQASRPRLARMMRRAEISSSVKKKFKMTTNSSHKFHVPENVLYRNFKSGILGALWESDVTYIRIKKVWLYLFTKE